MTQIYKNYITDVGLRKLTTAQTSNSRVILTHIAVGDGEYTPEPVMTSLVSEKWRGEITSLDPYPSNPNWLVAETIIPTNEGGWYVREMGVYDEDGDLIAIGNAPASYKPVVDSGAAKEVRLQVILELVNVDTVEMVIDPNIVTASKKFVEDIVAPVYSHLAQIDNVTDIDVTKYGVIADAGLTDNTAAIHAAFADNPNATKFKFPGGIIAANIVLPRGSIMLKGETMQKTEITAYDIAKPTIDTNKKFYVTLKNMTISAPYESVASTIVSAIDSRYLCGEDVYIYQKPNENDEYSYSAIALNLKNVVDYWSGYNTFKRCRFSHSSYGLITGSGLHSVLNLEDCIFWGNGYFGAKLEGVEVGILKNIEVSNNGKLGSEDNLDETVYGGIYVKGKNIDIQAVWNEFNINGNTGFYANNIYIHPDSVDVEYHFARGNRNSSNGLPLSEDMGNNQAIAFTGYTVNDGLGKERIKNVLKNGVFKYFTNDDLPASWEKNVGTGTVVTKEISDLPKGFESGLRLYNNSAGGIRGFYQTIYDPNQIGEIRSLANYIGKYVTLTAWIKVLSNTDRIGVRLGFDTGVSGSNVTYTTGKTQSVYPLNQWIKVNITLKITGNEGRILAGFRTLGATDNPTEIITTGFAVSFSPRVNDSEGFFITEDGGDILSQDFKIGGKRHGYGTTAPTSGTWERGDYVKNTNPSVLGEAGSQYLIKGWTCVTAGMPGTWKEDIANTGG